MEHLKEKYQKQISSVLLDGFESELLEAAFTNLLNPNPLRLNNFSYALRELTRHLLHRLAPAEELAKCSWFVPDSSSSNGITRKHRIKFSIQGGLSDFYVQRKLHIDDIDTVASNLVAIVSQLSNYTHIEKSTFDSDEAKVEQVATECLEVTMDFVNKIGELREHIAEKLLHDISEKLTERINCESVVELMEISTHQYIEYVTPEDIFVESISSSSILIKISGSIEVELIYGSGSDHRRGDGATISDTFPMSSEMEIYFKQPLGSEIDMKSFAVDTSSWFE